MPVFDGMPFPWVERIEEDGWASGSASFSATDSAKTMTIDIDMSGDPCRMQDIPGAILGYPVYFRGADWPLSRVLPFRHPEFNRMWARKIISMKGFKPKGKYFDIISGKHYTRFYGYRVTIEFGVPPYPILSDSEVAQYGNLREFFRYTKTDAPELGIDNIIRRGSRFRFAKVTPTTTANGGLPPGQTANDTMDLGLIKRAGKAHIKWTWMQVPSVALFGPAGTRIPQNIFGALGMINDAPFPPDSITTINFPKHTLLFLPPKFTPENAPVEEETIAPGYGGYPPRLYNVEMNIAYFNPDVHPTWNATDEYPYRGHNLVPPTSRDANPYWWLATSDSSANATDSQYWLYQPYDFTKIFQLPISL